ncbi:MAG: HEAT repeat domain-containing protein [Deltaproteobacteria bacterium]|jgi:hypothetical protein|nr:HEAT repeat domain-containing protein [Deltaproteobacteria bacterium]
MSANPGESALTGLAADPFAGTAAPAPVPAPASGGRAAKDRLSEAARELQGGLHQFVVAMKNLALYPETSQTNIAGIRQLHGWFTRYIGARGPVALTVRKDGLYTDEGEQVYLERPNEAILSFPLFRDGVQQLFFEEGLTEVEIKGFILILLKFRTTNENSQDDVVTGMWEAAFQGIKYSVADEYEEVGSEFDTEALVCARPPSAPGDPSRPDPDAPWQAEMPVQTDGSAPIAKSIGSLFALADSLDFSFAPGGADGKVADPHEGGKLLPSGPGGGAGGPGGGPAGPGGGSGGGGAWGGGPVSVRIARPGEEGIDDDGFAPLQDADGEADDGGFAPMGGGAGPALKPPPGIGSDGAFYKDPSGRVKRGHSPGGNGSGGNGSGGGAGHAREGGEWDEDPDEAGLRGRQGADVGRPGRGRDGDEGGWGGGQGDGGGTGEAAGDGGPADSVYDPDGDPDGHPVKGPADAAGAEPDGGGDDDSPFGKALQNLDLSSLSADSMDERTEMSQPVTLSDEEDRPEIDEKLQEGRAQRLKFWGLSAREIKQVGALIQWDEARAKSSSILDLVMVLVKAPILRPSMLPSLTAFVAEESRQSAARLSLAHVNAFLARLQDLSAKAGWEGPVPRLRSELQKALAEPQFLASLCEAVPDDAACAEHYESLRYFLYQLPQGSAGNLAETLPAARSLSLKKLIIEVIAWQIHSAQDGFAKLAQSLNEWALLELTGMLQAMRRPLTPPMKSVLLKHRSPPVRALAARLVLEVEPDSIQSVAHLIVDPDPRVRTQVAPFLLRRRDPHVETVLRSYLADLYARKSSGADLLEHYCRLGLCGSRASAPFLTEVLMKRDLGSLFGASADNHRTGAALALMLLPESSGAGEVVRRASRSAFRAVRAACAQAARLASQAAGALGGEPIGAGAGGRGS